MDTYTKTCNEISLSNITATGVKNLSLCEMHTKHFSKGIPEPYSVNFSSVTFKDLLAYKSSRPSINKLILSLHGKIFSTSKETGARTGIKWPDAENNQLFGKYYVDVAVRSSVAAEDLSQTSFGGQDEIYVTNIIKETLLNAAHKYYAH